ncbi:MAG: UvrD-helicase domain-containing protein [Bacilli bacterium]|nr:UvrD-helicase domain-containing protein [Bacilli bacterium]MDD4407204.1 UvrD-helicase domain-containing protein [Bacilli bacterium]
MKWTKEQLEAIKTNGYNIIVSAGAGSGKTAVLTERVITKLKNGLHINDLLILTFTNNAAKEMKERIKKAITEIPELKEEINYIDSADIKTFDAYVLSLVKKYYYLLNLEKDINIIDNSIILLKKKEILNDIFNNWYTKNNCIFEDFITTFGVKNDKEIKNLILNLDQKLDLLIDKTTFLNNYINNYYNENNINKFFDDYLNLIKKRIASINNCLYNLKLEINSDYYQKLDILLSNLIKSENYEEIKTNANIDIPRLPNNSSDNAKYFKGEIINYLNNIKTMTLSSKNDLIKEVFQTNDFAKIIISILSELNEKITNYKFKVNHFEYNDISKLAIKLLKENDDVKIEIKNKYQEIMIDEYQDTSNIQEEFISLIENNNVYVVGDIKQSIYRFRNANPTIFKQKYDLYKNKENGIKIDLNKNFRSRNEVINSINNIFNYVMDDDIGNANYKEEHQLEYGYTKYSTIGKNNYNNDLTILNYQNNKEYDISELEAFIIAKDIKQKIKDNYLILKNDKLIPCTYNDFCILIDRNTSFDIYKKIFNFFQIPINLYKDENILHNDETYLIKNIITLIFKINNKNYDNIFKASFISIARSYLYDLLDEEIFIIFKDNSYFKNDIFIKCTNIASELNEISNKELIEKIIVTFNFYHKLISAGNIEYRTIILNNLLDKADELNKVGITLDNLEDYFNTLIANNDEITISAIPTGGNSVTLTNIHKSKGLEYNICYYSGLNKRFNLKDPIDKFIFSEEYGLILPNYNNGIKKTFIFNLYKEKYNENEISEKIRLFYVALTRCKEKMIMLTSINKEKLSIINQNKVVDYTIRINYRSFQDLLISIYNVIDKYIIEKDLIEIDQNYKLNNKTDFNNKENNLSIEVNEEEFKREILTKNIFSKNDKALYTNKEKENMNTGTKIHYILENIDFINPDYSILENNEKDFIKHFLSLSILKNIKDATIFKEYEFINEENNKIERGIIDLMLIYKDHIDIIDYKLKNTNDDAYKLQLEGYKNYIEKKTYKKTNIYLYSILDKELIKMN